MVRSSGIRELFAPGAGHGKHTRGATARHENRACYLLGVILSRVVRRRAPAYTSDAEMRRFEATQPQMGVPFKILLYAADQTAANRQFEAAFSRIAELNRVLSDYDPHSELSRLSQARDPCIRCQ